MHLAQHPSGTAAPGAATTRWRRIAGAIGLCVAAVVLALPATVAAGDKALGRAGPVRMGDRYADLQRQARWTVDANASLDDCLMVTGGVTRHLEEAVQKTYNAAAEPKLVLAVGTCACGGGIVGQSYASRGGVDQLLPVTVYIPGCPPRPQALIEGILLAIDRCDHQLKPDKE